MEKSYSIRDLAQEFQITTRTIRFYEEQELISPTRKGQTRIYSVKDRTRLKLILRGKRLGLSLAETSELLQMYSPEEGNVTQLKAMMEKIEEKQNQLQDQMNDIKLMMEELEQAHQRCANSLRESIETDF